MARNDYAEDVADADELIGEFGQGGLLVRPGTSTGSAHNPAPGAPTDYPAIIVVLGYSVREIDGSRILATDKKVLLAKKGLSVEPATADKLVIGGVAHSIVSIEPLSPGGVIVLWTLQCRR